MVNNAADNTFTYKTVQRVCCADALIPLALEDIFDFTEGCEFLFEIPEEDYEKVKAKIYNYGIYGNYGKTKSKGFPNTSKPSAPNVPKFKKYYYSDNMADYDYYSDYGDYPYSDYGGHWDSVSSSPNAQAVGKGNIEENWSLGYEATADVYNYKYISSILRRFYRPNDTLLYSDEEFKQIEAAASDFINAVELPEDHPYRIFSMGIQRFMSNLVESISDIHAGPRSDVDKVVDPSKAFCVAIASSIYGVEDELFVKNSPIAKIIEPSGIKHLCLPERIAHYLQKF